MYSGEEKDCAADQRVGCTGSTPNVWQGRRHEANLKAAQGYGDTRGGFAVGRDSDYPTNTMPVVLTELYARRCELQSRISDLQQKLSMLDALINIWQ